MPHVWIEDGDYHLIPRITEIVSVMDCEKKASLHPVHTGRSNYYEMSTYVALKGTLVHHKIENYIRQKLQMQPLMLDLSPGDREMYNEVLSDPDKTAWINGQIEIGWENFLKFERDFKPYYLVPEQSMIYVARNSDGSIDHKSSAKGTVDLICEIDPERMSEKAYKILPIDQRSTVILDWKSGRSKVDSHHTQLEGYHWLIGVTGTWDELVEDGTVMYPMAHITNATGRSYPISMCVLLGGKSYSAHVYDMTEGKFEEARKLFFDPKPIVLSRTKWTDTIYRESYGCNFCVYRDNGCDIFSIKLFDETGKVIA